MADIYLETPTLNHNFEEYSLKKISEELFRANKRNESFGARATTDEERALYEQERDRLHADARFLKDYADEFPVLYRIRQHAFEDDEEGKKVDCTFKDTDFRKPEIMTEKHSVEDKKSQLELECTFENGLKFGLSAVMRDGAESKLLTGQISLPDETLEKLNAENLARILDFCERHGFSTYNLTIPSREGIIAAEEKINALTKILEEYNAKLLAERDKPLPPAPSEDEHDLTGFDEKNYGIIADVPVTSIPVPPEMKASKAPAPKEPMAIDAVRKSMRKWLEDDHHKKLGLSYWEHSRRVEGERMTVFSVYDKEDRENYREDGKRDPKKPHIHVHTFSYRFYLKQKSDGRFVFGYATNGKKMDDAMAGSFIGEIKKTGTTHLNLKNMPEQDKMVWMLACAEKGIVPTGVSINQAKAEKMLKVAQEKLSTQEFATFERRLMVQMEDYAKEKGKTLPISEQTFIEKRKNESHKLLETQSDMLEAAEFEKGFYNFRRAYSASDGIQTMVNDAIRNGSLNKKDGAADAIAAMNTLARTFDIVVDDNNNLDTPLSVRLEHLVSHPTKNSKGDIILVRLSEAEKNALLASVPDKKIRDLTKEDYQFIYKKLFERQRKQAAANIIQRFEDDEASRAHAKDHVLIGEEWNIALGQVVAINDRLVNQIGAEKLELPDKHRGLSFERPEELKFASVKAREEAKAKAKEAKEAAAKMPPAPDRGRGGM